MVKADVKHNYYADLELPTTASIDDIKKQYRKLALQYHPDRNAGKEEEFVPKFQAIQTAHEILGDATVKAKYDADRRKAGLYPTFTPRQPTTGNPYAATSAYPPPPRRTAPQTWQRPQPFAAAGATPTGADRFANFGRGAPTARKDPAQDRTNMFKAWQNMNTGQDRQQRFTPGGTPGGPPAGAQASPNRPRPPPRNDPKLPSEEEIRAGMNYRKAPPHMPQSPQFDSDGAEARRSAWQSYQQSKPAGHPGISRTNTTKTPKKQGFDPNAPGSDERPAAGSGYGNRHRSEDLGRPPNTHKYPPPPPPPGPPPLSPISQQRPFADPLRPFKSRTVDDREPQVPYAEGNRVRTPYTSFIGEKTPFQREDGLRRSASQRDTTKLNINGTNNARARSTSPLGGSSHPKDHAQNGSAQQAFGGVDYSDSDGSANEKPMSTTPEDYDSGSGEPPPGTAPQSKSPFAPPRPKKTPTPRSRRFNGSTDPTSAPPPSDGAQSDTETRPGMQQKTSNNMYVDMNPLNHDYLHHSPFAPGQWAAHLLGTNATSSPEPPKAIGIPDWAIPPVVRYGCARKSLQPSAESPEKDAALETLTCEKCKHKLFDEGGYTSATADERAAYHFLASEMHRMYGSCEYNYDMETFLMLASTARMGEQSGNMFIDRAMRRTFELYPSVASERSQCGHANQDPPVYSFNFPYNHDPSSTNNRSQSEEKINTQFSPDGFRGTFSGSPDYFNAPQTAGKKSSSPSSRQKSDLRSVMTQGPTSNSGTTSVGEMPRPPRPAGLEEEQPEPNASGPVKFTKEEWEKKFKDPSWTWAPPPKPPSPVKVAAKAKGRKSSRANGKPAASSGTEEHPHVVADKDGTFEAESADGKPEHDAPIVDDGDAMDIDPTPPAQSNVDSPSAKEHRLYSVPPSAWRQSQQAQVNGHGTTSSRQSGDVNPKAGLHGLADVEPLNRNANAEGLRNLGDMNLDLPFESQASNSLPTHPLEPKTLQIPAIPKAPESPTKLTKESWHAFVAQFSAYLGKYHDFKRIMLMHFSTREQAAQDYLAAGTSWLEATGDTMGSPSGPNGFGKYSQGIKEDEQVREAWAIGCERHLQAVKKFENIRERVRRQVMSSGLPDR